jgi:glycoside hydrolase-like protein
VSLPGEVEGAIAAIPGFDCDKTISATAAQRFYSQGYRFCLRYLSRGPNSSQDLTEQEATDILNAGLALMPVQHVRDSGWSPNQALGQQDGQEAAANAQTVGFPDGVNVWCDLEGVIKSAQPQDVIDYCEAWYEAASAAGYIPGLYVGAGALLTGQQLYDLSFQDYWRSASDVPDIPNRSYQLFQFSPSIELNGISIDLDVPKTDKEGGAAQWPRVSTGA